LHLEERGGDQWVLPVWAAVHRSIAAGRTRAITPELSELGVHISARLNVLPRIVDRINSEVPALFEAVKHHGPEHVYTDTAEGRAFPVDNNLKYQLIADIDSLLFEIFVRRIDGEAIWSAECPCGGIQAHGLEELHGPGSLVK